MTTSESDRVVEVYLRESGNIEVLYGDGTTRRLQGPYSFGYSGTGPSYFAGWFRSIGFAITEEQVAAMKAPKTLTK